MGTITAARGLRDYKLEIGNSSSGDIGLVAYTSARNKREAAKNFREKLITDGDATIELCGGMYFANVYLGEKAISAKNTTPA